MANVHMKVVCFSPIETTEKKQSRIAARECKRKVRDPVEWRDREQDPFTLL